MTATGAAQAVKKRSPLICRLRSRRQVMCRSRQYARRKGNNLCGLPKDSSRHGLHNGSSLCARHKGSRDPGS